MLYSSTFVQISFSLFACNCTLTEDTDPFKNYGVAFKPELYSNVRLLLQKKRVVTIIFLNKYIIIMVLRKNWNLQKAKVEIRQTFAATLFSCHYVEIEMELPLS